MRYGQPMDERLTALEIKMAYLERAYGELDGVVRTWGEQMELLRREVMRLRSSQALPTESPANDKPPHY